MSFDSAVGGVGLSSNEVWHELRVKADPLSWMPTYPLNNTNYYFKFVHDTTTSSFALILTDLCYVWIQRLEKKEIDAKLVHYNPSVQKKKTAHIIGLVETLLLKNDSEQFHLVRLDMESEENHAADSSEEGNRTPDCHVESSMSIGEKSTGSITFRWKFQLKSYGSLLDQSIYLRSQMLLPLHEMIKLLSFQLSQERSKNQQLKHSQASASLHVPAAGAAAAAGLSEKMRHGDPAHAHSTPPIPALAHLGASSLSMDLPSLSTTDREAQAGRIHGADVAGGLSKDGAPIDFDKYNSQFTFSQLAPLYIDALRHINGEESVNVSGLPPSSFENDLYASSQNPSGNLAPPSPSRPAEPKYSAAQRRKNAKRERSPSPAAGTSAAAAAAAAGGYAASIPPASYQDSAPELDFKHGEDAADEFPTSIPPAIASSLMQPTTQEAIIDDAGNYLESKKEQKNRELLKQELDAERAKKRRKKKFV